MKLTDFLSDVGRPVAYYPALRRITGSTNATILLCQFIYWRGKESDPNGWLYKESDEIEQETGLSYGEQKTARRNLLEAGLIEEHYARLDHQMKFRLNLEVINEKWGNEETVIPESGKPQLGNDTKPLSLTESETTTEKTTETATTTDFGSICKVYSDNIALITPMIADELKDIADLYPAGWFEDAVKEAVKNNVRKLNYVKKILESWQANGRGGQKNNDKSSMFETLT